MAQRLFEKVLKNAPSDVVETMKDSIVIASDVVAKHYCDSAKQDWDSTTDFPAVRAPYEKVFMEWNNPLQVRTDNGVQPNRPGQAGIFCHSKNVTERMREHFARMMDEMPAPLGGGDAFNKEVAIRDAAVAIAGRAAFHHENQVGVSPFVSIWLIREDGLLLHTGMMNDGRVPIETLYAAQASGQNIQDIGCWHVCWLALSLINCRNVKLVDVSKELAPEPKIARRLGLPQVRRYTISIDGHTEIPKRDFRDPVTQGLMPFHLCRGHFATYTADKPMFGNPKLVGRFWHPPHTRGDKKNGEVIKDYDLDKSLIPLTGESA